MTAWLQCASDIQPGSIRHTDIFEMLQIEHFEVICSNLKFKETTHLHEVSCASEVFASIEGFHVESQKVYTLHFFS